MRGYEQRILDRAKEATGRGNEGEFNEEKLIAKLAELVPFDIEQERLQKARSLLDRSKRPGSTKKDGQLLLPGFNEAYDNEPLRMVSDDDGNVIESYLQRPRYKTAEVGRKQVNVERAVVQLRRSTAENALFQRWALEQALLGRPESELIWDNCVKELGLWRPDAAVGVA